MRVNYNFAVDLEGNRYIELPDGSVEKQDEADLYRIYEDNIDSDVTATEEQAKL